MRDPSGVLTKMPHAALPVPGLQQNGTFLYESPVLTPSASSTCDSINWPRLLSGPNFSPSPYTGSPEPSAKAASHCWPRARAADHRQARETAEVLIGDRGEAPLLVLKQLDRQRLARRFPDARCRNVNVQTPGAGCATSQRCARPRTSP